MVMLNSFQPVSISFISSCLCFNHPPTLLLLGVRILNEISILFMWCSSFFSINVLIRWFIVKMLKSFKFIILLFSNSAGGCNSRFGVDLILFLFSQCFLIPVHQLIILLLLFIPGVLKIHNSILILFKLVWALLSYSSLLIQPVQYLSSNLFQRWFP